MTSRQVYMLFAVLSTLSAMLALDAIRNADWISTANGFDIAGFLALILNIERIPLVIWFVVSVLVALPCWTMWLILLFFKEEQGEPDAELLIEEAGVEQHSAEGEGPQAEGV